MILLLIVLFMVVLYLHKQSITYDFDCYVINLAKSEARLNHFVRVYNTSDLKGHTLIRYEAVDGRTIDVKPFLSHHAYDDLLVMEKTDKRVYHSQLTRGAIGCYLSHLGVYEAIQKSGKEYAIIFEDDVSFDRRMYHTHIKPMMENIPKDWDIILLGRIDIDAEYHDKYVTMKDFWCLYGYIINQKGIATMQKHGNIPFSYQIDKVMSQLAQKGILHIYAPKENIIPPPQKFGSDIQNAVETPQGIDAFTDPYA